jgi:tetratricopeptide (TPR) repeat protein
MRGYRPEQGFAVLREGIERTDSDELRATLASFTPDAAERDALLARLRDRDDPATRASVASVRLGAGDAAAFDEIRRLAEAHPDDERVQTRWLWTLLDARMRGGTTPVPAAPLIEARIAREPDRVLGHWMRAQLLVADRAWDALLAATAEALARFPDEETMMALRGRAYKEKGDLDRAAHCFARAIGMKASFAGARVELGKVYEAKGRADLAEEVFREVPAANPDYAGGSLSLALFLARQGRWDEAESLVLETWPRLQPWQRARLARQPDVAALLERERVKAAL